MFTTGSLGDYLGIPTRKSYLASSEKVTSTISYCSSSDKVTLVNSAYSWDNIISVLGFNKTLSQVPGVTCSSTYDESSTVLISTNPVKVQRYRNANLTFTVINDINRDYISRGLLVGIRPGNTVVHTWEFNIPVNNKDTQINMAIPLGDLVDIFDNVGPDQDGVQFYMLLRSADSLLS